MQSSARDELRRWTSVWRSEDKPRFDASASSPALLRLLESDEAVSQALRGDESSGARVLVPGCGRGYDIASFARAAAASASSSSPSGDSKNKKTVITGWDYVPEAVRSAKEWLESPESGLAELKRRNGSSPLVAVEVEQADFFQRAFSSSPSFIPFTLAFDYTFFCALPPPRREEWARAYSRLLAPGKGLLITLVFPCVPPPALGVDELPREEREAFQASFGTRELVEDAAKAEGPPWPVSLEEYKRVLLSDKGALFELVSCEAVPAKLSHRGRGGREMIAVWRRTTARKANENDEKLSAL
jgi:SAM-dependent methyltransferase